MAMKVSNGGGDQAMSDFNATPLIGVMLVLLVMLIMTLPVQNHSVTMQSYQTPSREPPPQSIYIDFDSARISPGMPKRTDADPGLAAV